MTDNKAKGGGEQNLTVALRIRPMNEDEILIGATQIAHKVQKKMVVLMDPSEDPEDVLRANRSREKQFVYDYTFDGGASQEDVYKITSKFLIPNVINGYNATVFAYGATGAGKTYTMLGSDDDPGIMARALNDLFLEMEKTKENMAYRVSMSYLEIYNEMIRDLLNPSSGLLDLREDAKGGVQVAGLSEVTAGSTHEVMTMLLMGNKERTQEPTAANKTSSRSHAVLQVIIKQQNRVRNTMQEVRIGKLFMIDLAGSERAANTHNRGKRMVEGAHINRSLLALGNCINALTDPKGSKYVNYRDSKLTRLLKDALGGNCKTVMIAHISPASIHFEESRNTLVYADRAKHIKTKVRRNVTDVSYHIAQYTNIISELREEINRLRYKLQDKSSSLQTSLNFVGGSSGANINTVQAEVIGSKREELTKLKEQLLISFKDQMELRKSLMELNNASMEVSLETNRNQLVISEWEYERARASRRKEGGEYSYSDDAKALELQGAGSDEISEPEDVKLAREELKVLHDEKHRTEKLRATVQKELEQAKVKTKKVEETIPQRVSTEDQREILNLLCKVHELEIENTEAQSACLLRDFQIKRKDIIISRYRQHQSLCDKIIQKQRQLMEEKKLTGTKDLDELYDLYKMERDERMMLREDTAGHLSPELRLKAPSITSNYRSNLQEEIDQLRTLAEEDERGNLLSVRSRDGDDTLFSPSARARQIREGAWRNNSSLGVGEGHDYLGTLPSPGRKSLEDRNTISTGTRSIAALAAKKRSKAQNDLLNLERQFGGEPRALYRPSSDRGQKDKEYLSPSLLAKHDNNYGDLVLPSISKHPSEDNLSTGTKQSENTDSTLPPIGSKDNYRQGRADLRRNRRTRGYDLGYPHQNGGYGKGRPAPGNGKTGNENKQTRSLSSGPKLDDRTVTRPTSRSKSQDPSTTSTSRVKIDVKPNNSAKKVKSSETQDKVVKQDKIVKLNAPVSSAKANVNSSKQVTGKQASQSGKKQDPPKGSVNNKAGTASGTVTKPGSKIDDKHFSFNVDRSLTMNITSDSPQQSYQHKDLPVVDSSNEPVNSTKNDVSLTLQLRENLVSPESSYQQMEDVREGRLTYRTSKESNNSMLKAEQPTKKSDNKNAVKYGEIKTKDFFITSHVTRSRESESQYSLIDKRGSFNTDIMTPDRNSGSQRRNPNLTPDQKPGSQWKVRKSTPDQKSGSQRKVRNGTPDQKSGSQRKVRNGTPDQKPGSQQRSRNKVADQSPKESTKSQRKTHVPTKSAKTTNSSATKSSKVSTPQFPKDDSVLNITGKPPTGVRPRSVRSNVFTVKKEKRGKLRAKSDTDIPKLPGGNVDSVVLSGNKRVGKKNTKVKVQPSIPVYKKGDIAITGFSLSK